MNESDVMELRKRFKKDTSISRMAGCYVDSNKQKVLKLNEVFLNLEADEFYKFLEIAKKTLGGTPGNNILELDYERDQEAPGGRQQFLMGLRESNLTNEDLLDRLYDLVIENYSYVGNYLILVFHDTYDIMKRTSDNNKLDESEEVYDYLLVSVCPVELSKAGLGYREDEHRIGARVRDWVVGVPEIGFLFPAFNDHSADIHKVDYFIKDPKDSHAEFAEGVLGCGSKRTNTEKREAFKSIVKKVFSDSEDKAEDVFADIQESFSVRVNAGEDEEEFAAPIVLDDAVMDEILVENGIEGDEARNIKEVVKTEFEDEMPTLDVLLDEKLVRANAKEKEKKELVKEVCALKEEIKKNEEEKAEIAEVTTKSDLAEFEVILSVKPEKTDSIRTEMIDGKKCIVIPMSENEHVKINGVRTEL
ncbi:MAG: DUF4317 domain-containing protein [Lachnospiraceae bacterium]|nr:DUF4317 domain-containing protein [Lachnospiraceae bacterium]